MDFDTDVWPLIARELVWAHYRELFTGHPERVRGTWEEFRSLLSEHADDAPALDRAAEAFVPDPLDRFDVPRFDRPLGDETFVSDDDLQERIRRHIADDLTLRTTQDRSSAQAVFLAALFSFMALADIPTERWSARSRAVALPLTWHTFFSYLASGPPSHRLEELVALSQAGIVHFLGPEVTVRIDPSARVRRIEPAGTGRDHGPHPRRRVASGLRRRSEREPRSAASSQSSTDESFRSRMTRSRARSDASRSLRAGGC